jgi:hypothetical protein
MVLKISDASRFFAKDRPMIRPGRRWSDAPAAPSPPAGQAAAHSQARCQRIADTLCEHYALAYFCLHPMHLLRHCCGTATMAANFSDGLCDASSQIG